MLLQLERGQLLRQQVLDHILQVKRGELLSGKQRRQFFHKGPFARNVVQDGKKLTVLILTLTGLYAVGCISSQIGMCANFGDHAVFPMRKPVAAVGCLMIEHNFHHSLNNLKFRIVQ